MPAPMLRSLAKSSGKSLSELERYWDEAKSQATKEGKSSNYAYIVGIVKRRSGLSESRADLLLEKGGEAAGSLELLSTPVKRAREYAVKVFADNNRDLDKEIPDFDKNYLKAQSLAASGMTQRAEMPVIGKKDALELKGILKSGDIDVVAPTSDFGHPITNLFPQHLSGSAAQRFLMGGRQEYDGKSDDDKVNSTVKSIKASNLRPVQKQIYFDKVIAKIAPSGVKSYKNQISASKIAVCSKEGFLVDGHHKWLSALIMDPKMSLQVMEIDLPIHKLLPLSLSFSDAIGNPRNESFPRADRLLLEAAWLPKPFLDNLELAVCDALVTNPLLQSNLPLQPLYTQQLQTTQAYLDHNIVDQYAESGNVNGMLVLQRDGQYYIFDGHHRFFAAVKRGELQVQVRILPLGPFENGHNLSGDLVYFANTLKVDVDNILAAMSRENRIHYE